MKKWIIPMTWIELGTVEIEAKTLREALEIASDSRDISLPTNGEYVEGSDLIDFSFEEIRDLYNNGQEDDDASV